MTRIILLNGPPGSGKDFAANLIKENYLGRVHIDKFARMLKEAVHAAYGLIDEFGNICPHDNFESVKDEPQTFFMDKTPREVYIAYSETFLKPLHGEGIFGEMLSRELSGLENQDLIVISDSGFTVEAEVLAEWMGAENVELYHIWREGHDFSSDSRSYVSLSHLGIEAVTISNTGDEGFLKNIAQCVAGVDVS